MTGDMAQNRGGMVFGENLQFVFVMSAGGGGALGLAHFDICQLILCQN